MVLQLKIEEIKFLNVSSWMIGESREERRRRRSRRRCFKLLCHCFRKTGELIGINFDKSLCCCCCCWLNFYSRFFSRICVVLRISFWFVFIWRYKCGSIKMFSFFLEVNVIRKGKLILMFFLYCGLLSDCKSMFCTSQYYTNCLNCFQVYHQMKNV